MDLESAKNILVLGHNLAVGITVLKEWRGCQIHHG